MDTNYKQIIPYIMLKYKDSVFTYVRGNGSREKRLKMKYSIGLGGHIEDNKDRNLFTLENSFAYYFHAAEREIQEEVNLNSSYDDKIVALINDDSNEVGKVHFGVCHIWELDKPEISPKETSISNGKFYKIEDLEMLTTNLENWSLFAKDILMNYI